MLESWGCSLYTSVYGNNITMLSAINMGTFSSQLAMQWLHILFWLSVTHNFCTTLQYIPTVANTLTNAISHIYDPAQKKD